MSEASTIAIALPDGGAVSGLLLAPAGARAGYVMAHGAGADMVHPFMSAVAAGLGVRGIATLRYRFLSMEAGSKRPDRPATAHAAVRAAVQAAVVARPGLAWFAGGKSFGGRMTSQAQAEAALPGVRGLVFWGFPLHPPGKPSVTRAAHLADVAVQMLFLQGTRDALADMALLVPLISTLGARATLVTAEGADHAFHVPARSGRTDGEVLALLLDRMAAWVGGIADCRVWHKVAPAIT